MLPGDRGPIPAGRSDEELLGLVHRRADAIRFRRRARVASALVVVVALIAVVPVLAEDDEPESNDTASGPAENYGPADLRPGSTGSEVTGPAGTGFPIVSPTPPCRSQVRQPSGDEAVQLPDVVGEKEREALSDLDAVGVRVWVERTRSERATGVVVNQDPDAGYVQTSDCWVIITVSAGQDGPEKEGESETRS